MHGLCAVVGLASREWKVNTPFKTVRADVDFRKAY